MSIRLGNVFGGIATSINDRLKNSLDRTQDKADRILDRSSIRAEREVQREETQDREVAELLTAFSNMVDESQVPEGMTKHDYAAGLFKMGDGTIAGAKSYLADLKVHKQGGGSVKNLIDYSSIKTGGRNQAAYVSQFVRRADTLVKTPKGMAGGEGMAGKLFNVNLTKGVQDEIDLSFGKRTPTEKFQMDQLGFKEGSELLGTSDTKLDRKVRTTQLAQSEANLASTLADNALKGSIDTSQVNRSYNGVLADALKQANIPIDIGANGVPTFNVKTDDAKYAGVQKAYARSLTNVSENALKSLNVPGMKETLKTLATRALSFVVPNDPTSTGVMNIGGLYTDSDGSTVLYLGRDNEPILIRAKT